MGDLEKEGFLVIPKAFSNKEVNLLSDHFKSVDYDRKMHFKTIQWDEVRKDIHEQPSSTEDSESLSVFIDGHNVYVNCEGRVVRQLYMPIESVDKFKAAYPERRSEDGNYKIVKMFCDESMCFINDFFISNKKLLEKFIFTNKYVSKYTQGYTHMASKLFVNRPGCKDQEIHSDDLTPGLILIVPLNDCDNRMGTTILYNDNIVKKYNDSEELSFGHIESKSASVKADFSKAQTLKYFKAGDAVLFKTTTFHRGTENLSNKDRVFIYMHFTKPSRIEL